LYVEKKFPAEASREDDSKYYFGLPKSYSNLTWMSAETKIKAIEKLNKITIKIGYPDQWKDYLN
jgi:endothelin-converting enzyme/putative endopeptidase